MCEELIAAAGHHDTARAGGLSDLVNRLDGVKMLALAAVAAHLAVRVTWGRRPPHWLRAAAGLTAAALAMSGLDYLTLAAARAHVFAPPDGASAGRAARHLGDLRTESSAPQVIAGEPAGVERRDSAGGVPRDEDRF